MARQTVWIIVPTASLVALIIVGAVRFVHARNTPSENACIKNLLQLDGVKEQWALEKEMPGSAQPRWEDLDPYFSKYRRPTCPHGGVYSLNRVDESSTCSLTGEFHKLP